MKKLWISAVLILLTVTIVGCGGDASIINPGETISDFIPDGDASSQAQNQNQTATTREQETYGEDLTDSEIYDGYFEEKESDVTVSLISGSDGCWKLENGVLSFSGITEDTVYAISGKLSGYITAEIDDAYKLELELTDFSAVCEAQSPITVNGGKKITLTAKKGTKNYIYDNRPAVTSTEDGSVHTAAVYAATDLELSGKGELTVVSENNNGIHAKDDLEVKNLTLSVVCSDNALKGNDSVTLTDAGVILIAKQGDGIKTSNSSVSEKGKQRGGISINGGTYTVYAACDGIDAAYDVTIDGDSTVLNVYTDKYSSYSEGAKKSGEASAEGLNFIRFTSKNYNYSVKYYNSDSDYKWVNATYYSTVSGGRTNYYYYSYERLTGYDKVQFFIYNTSQQQGQETDCLVSSDYLEYNSSYDTFALSSRGNSLNYEWTNYTTNINDGWGGGGGPGGGPGGMADGNSDKSEYSAKGIKAANQIGINAGSFDIKSYDDAIHAGSGEKLENGESASGSVNIAGGTLTLYSNDDAIHADGILSVSNGNIAITNCYEGLEGTQVLVSGGRISVLASDDGINATATTGNGVTISGGNVYIYCTGDGIDSNSRTSYEGIVFAGGDVVVISNSQMNSSIDTENGYTYTGGRVIAIMPSQGMTSETTNCKNFSSVSTSKNISLTQNAYLTVTVDGKTVAAVKMPLKISSKTIYLGSKSATLATETDFNGTLDENGVYWN